MEESYWDIIEKAYPSATVYEGEETWTSEMKKYPSWVIDVLSVHWTVAEVENGGFAQYFLNTTGVMAPEALEGLKKLGSDKAAAMLCRAMNHLGSVYPRSRDVRAGLMAAKSDHNPKEKAWDPYQDNPFEDLEEEFFDLTGEIYAALDRYARNHA